MKFGKGSKFSLPMDAQASKIAENVLALSGIVVSGVAHMVGDIVTVSKTGESAQISGVIYYTTNKRVKLLLNKGPTAELEMSLTSEVVPMSFANPEEKRILQESIGAGSIPKLQRKLEKMRDRKQNLRAPREVEPDQELTKGSPPRKRKKTTRFEFPCSQDEPSSGSKKRKSQSSQKPKKPPNNDKKTRTPANKKRKLDAGTVDVSDTESYTDESEEEEFEKVNERAKREKKKQRIRKDHHVVEQTPIAKGRPNSPPPPALSQVVLPPTTLFAAAAPAPLSYPAAAAAPAFWPPPAQPWQPPVFNPQNPFGGPLGRAHPPSIYYGPSLPLVSQPQLQVNPYYGYGYGGFNYF